MTNIVYQTAVEELEAVLSPRVVSRSLKEGLRQHGMSPDTVDVGTLEEILKGQVYRQLQVTMPVTEAKSTVAGIVERLRQVSEGPGDAQDPRSGIDSQGDRLTTLQQALKPFNLYFEWPEVQKLRAQLQLLETEHESGREATNLVADAEAQLEVVQQKLEDQLVLQAREVGELSDALEVVRSLGGPKVRRLESLVNHMRSAQETRQLAPAELDRARKLARDLRKLMESSVYSERDPDQPGQAEAASETSAETAAEPATDLVAGPLAEGATGHADEPQAEAATELEGPAAATSESGDVPPAHHDGVYDVEAEDEEILAIDMSNLTPEASERLRLIDLAAESQDLAALQSEHANLLEYRPELAAMVAEFDADVREGRSVAARMPELQAALSEGAESVRSALRAELEELSAELDDLPEDVDAAELQQAVKVTLGILTTTLPAAADVEHVNQLHGLLKEQVEAQRRAEEAIAAQLRTQEDLVKRLEDTLVRYESHSPSEDVERLREELESLRIAQANRTIVPEVMASVRQAEERMVRQLAERATEESDRRRARIETLRAQLLSVPVTQTLTDRLDAARREIERLLEDQAGGEAASALLIDDPLPNVPVEGDLVDVEALESLVATLRSEAAISVRRRLERLGEQAAEIGSVRFGERLSTAITELENGVFPDLVGLEADLGRARESARMEQMGELHRLSREAQTYAGLDDPGVAEIQRLLASEREHLNAGGHARRLGEAALLLDRIESRFDERIAGIPARLDAALARFEDVAKLNSDDVATVRRILHHLDSQRESLGRISVGLRQQLEASLTQAEELIGNLEEEYEATRLIADQLVSEGLLDDVLGALGGATFEGPDSEPERQGLEPTELVERYADTPGVTAAVVYSLEGERLAGDSVSGAACEDEWLWLDQLQGASTGLLRPGAAGADDAAMGERPLGGLLILTAGTVDTHVVVAFATELVVALAVDSAALAPVVSGRLRRDLTGD